MERLSLPIPPAPDVRTQTPTPHVVNVPSEQYHYRRPRLSLTAVTTVCLARALPDPLASSIGDFLTPDYWTIEMACEDGLVQLLQQLIAVEEPNIHPLYRSHVFSQGLELAVEHDNAIELLQCLSEYCPTGFVGKGMTEAAALGKVDMLEWLVVNHPTIAWGPVYANRAAEGGHLNVLQWIKERSPDPDRDLATAMVHAAGSGRLAIIMWLHENVARDAISPTTMVDTLSETLEQGDLATLKYLHTQHRDEKAVWRLPGMDGETCIDVAVLSGNLEMIEWLYAHGHRRFHQNAVSDTRKPEIIRWLIKNSPKAFRYDQALLDAVGMGQRLDAAQPLQAYSSAASLTKAVVAAASDGYLDIVQQLFRSLPKGRRFRRETIQSAVEEAARNGHLEMVQWLHARHTGTERPRYDICETTVNGHFEVVKWLVENSDQNDDTDVLDFAVESRNLEMVIWLHENTSARCSEEAMGDAADTGDLHIVKWLHENRSEGCTTEAMDIAAQHNHLDVVKWLHENRTEGCTTDAMDNTKSIKVVKWLYANRTEGCTTKAMDNAAARGDFDMLLFLHENRTEGCTIQAALNARYEGFLSVFQWLVENYPKTMKREVLRKYVNRWPNFTTAFLDAIDVKQQ